MRGTGKCKFECGGPERIFCIASIRLFVDMNACQYIMHLRHLFIVPAVHFAMQMLGDDEMM